MQEGITSAFREGYRCAWRFDIDETGGYLASPGKAAIRSAQFGDDYLRGWNAARATRKLLVRQAIEAR